MDRAGVLPRALLLLTAALLVVSATADPESLTATTSFGDRLRPSTRTPFTPRPGLYSTRTLPQVSNGVADEEDEVTTRRPPSSRAGLFRRERPTTTSTTTTTAAPEEQQGSRDLCQQSPNSYFCSPAARKRQRVPGQRLRGEPAVPTSTTTSTTTTTTTEPPSTTTRRALPVTMARLHHRVRPEPEQSTVIFSNFFLPADKASSTTPIASVAPLESEAAQAAEVVVEAPNRDRQRDICKDAFHSFLCAPLKPRKRITGNTPPPSRRPNTSTTTPAPIEEAADDSFLAPESTQVVITEKPRTTARTTTLRSYTQQDAEDSVEDEIILFPSKMFDDGETTTRTAFTASRRPSPPPTSTPTPTRAVTVERNICDDPFHKFLCEKPARKRKRPDGSLDYSRLPAGFKHGRNGHAGPSTPSSRTPLALLAAEGSNLEEVGLTIPTISSRSEPYEQYEQQGAGLSDVMTVTDFPRTTAVDSVVFEDGEDEVAGGYHYPKPLPNAISLRENRPINDQLVPSAQTIFLGPAKEIPFFKDSFNTKPRAATRVKQIEADQSGASTNEQAFAALNLPLGVGLMRAVYPRLTGVYPSQVPSALPHSVPQGALQQSIPQGTPQRLPLVYQDIPQSVPHGVLQQSIPQGTPQRLPLVYQDVPQSAPQGTPEPFLSYASFLQASAARQREEQNNQFAAQAILAALQMQADMMRVAPQPVESQPEATEPKQSKRKRKKNKPTPELAEEVSLHASRPPLDEPPRGSAILMEGSSRPRGPPPRHRHRPRGPTRPPYDIITLHRQKRQDDGYVYPPPTDGGAKAPGSVPAGGDEEGYDYPKPGAPFPSAGPSSSPPPAPSTAAPLPSPTPGPTTPAAPAASSPTAPIPVRPKPTPGPQLKPTQPPSAPPPPPGGEEEGYDYPPPGQPFPGPAPSPTPEEGVDLPGPPEPDNPDVTPGPSPSPAPSPTPTPGPTPGPSQPPSPAPGPETEDGYDYPKPARAFKRRTA